MTESLETELKKKFWLFFFAGDQPNDLFAETLGDFFSLNISYKAVLVRLADEITRGGGGHIAQPAVA
jgi:hypothetical protein